jgi:hypothetical protein
MIRYLILFNLFYTFYFFSQDVRDLVRYSQTQYYGSARFESMAGAFGALGADLSTSAINPAGFARFSKSNFGFSMQNTSIQNNASFNNTNTISNPNLFRLNNIGFVLANDVSENNNGFIFTQFGFSYNRIENFKDKISYKGEQFYSLLDEFASTASGFTPDEMYIYVPFTSALAWETYAIDPNPDVINDYYPNLNDFPNSVIHDRTITYGGGMSEYNFNLSGNYMNKLYIGGNIGLRTSNYSENYTHSERATNTSGMTLDSFQYEYNLKTKGSGQNIKLGLIYLPIERLRIGFSLHTPTFLKMKDYFDANMTSYHKDTTYTIDEDFQPYGEYKYRLRTPSKFIFSLAYIFGTVGAINLDVDVVNYKWAHLKETDDTNYEPFDFSPINNIARSQTRTVLNLRLGGEMVILTQFFIRAGIALYPSAYDPKVAKVKNNTIYSGGFGYRWKKSALDVALRLDNRAFNYYAFSLSETQIKQNRTSISLNYSINF